MFPHERQSRILALLERQRRLEVQGLPQLLGVSPATLQRDLAFLEQHDRVVRVHGGVVHPEDIRDEPTFREKSALAIKAKRAIGDAAAESIARGATVFVDSGTTCLEAGRLLRGREDLTIITNSLPLIATHEHFRARLLVLGGERRGVSGALVGDLAMTALSRLRADVALIGASALHVDDGAGSTELTETAVKQQWIARSRRTVLLADATKWSEDTMVSFAAWTEFEEFYTDRNPPVRLPANSAKVIVV
jgi:DeoR/GlpR family transcriptional regulator of sugar metabolism